MTPTRKIRHLLSLAAAAALAIGLGETLTARTSFAEVYAAATTSMGGALAELLGAPERAPRALLVNGQPLSFAPYSSDRPVADLAADWSRTLQGAIVPIPYDGADAEQSAQAAVALAFLPPKVAVLSDEFATVVQFFDGDGRKAMAHVQATAKGGKPGPIPATVVTLRRPAGADRTDVLMSRMDDTTGMLSAFAAAPDADEIPTALKPPAGATVLMDLSDEGDGHRSRSVVVRAPVAARAWAERRAVLLSQAGFTVEATAAGTAGITALRARRAAEEADVLYTAGAVPGEVVEVIHIREPLAGGTSR